jgi:hypothetical protein
MTRPKPARQRTSKPAERTAAEGSLRRRWDHYITHLDDARFGYLTAHWDDVRLVLDQVLTAGTPAELPPELRELTR